MKLSVTSWSFPHCSLQEAVRISKVLDIHAIDLGYLHQPALDRKKIIQQPRASAKKIRNYDITVPCFYHLFGDNTVDSNLSLEDHDGENLRQLEAVSEFCSEASIDTLFVLPGVINPGQSAREAMARSAENLRHMVDICEKKGVSLAVEPHVGSCLESPALVHELLDRVPGLTLVLDYAHFVCLGYTQDAIDELIPYASHMHLRQTKPGNLQTDLETGTINFQAMLGALAEESYEGYLSIEYVHQHYKNTLHEDVLTETIKMRNLVRAWNQKR